MQAEQNTNTNLLDYYQNSGFKTIRVSADAKRAIDREWQHRDVPLEKLEEHVERGGNIALQMGKVSDWLCAVDNDGPEAVALAPKFLPDTLKGGRNGEARNYLYRSPGAGYAKFQDGTEELLCLKASNNGKGHYVVVEPSRHPDKGRYEWRGGFNPAAIAEVPANELKKRAELLAAAALIARRLPPRGRHDLALALAGYLLRNGETPEDVLRVLEAAWGYHDAPREAFRDLQGIVKDTAEKLEQGEPVKGGRTLEELLPGIPRRLAKFLGWESVDNRETSPSDGEGRMFGRFAGEASRTDTGNAGRFARLFGGRVIHSHALGGWAVYDGRRYLRDEAGQATELGKAVSEEIWREAGAAFKAGDDEEAKSFVKWSLASRSAGKIGAMLDLAKSEPGIPAAADDLDKDPYLLNVLNGTIDLRTGEIRDHHRDDLITKLAPVEHDPGAAAPAFEQFLREVLPDEALRQFVQRVVGYCLTGDVSEQILPFLYGTGANGKSTLINVVLELMGDYAQQAAPELLMMKKGAHPTELAELKGRRFVPSVEVEDGRRFAESLVKQLTGGERVRGRFMHKDFFEFAPTHKVLLIANHKPAVRGTDWAIWRRIKLIPFEVVILDAEQDKSLPDKLRSELPGILNWAIEGCLEWQREGLGEPDAVTSATREYREEQDTVAGFIEECCIVAEGATGPAKALWDAYRTWCEDAGEHVGTQTRFGTRLTEKGFVSDRYTSGPHKGRKFWRGIGLLNPDPPDDPSPESPKNPDNGSPVNGRGEPFTTPESAYLSGKRGGKHSNGEQFGPENKKMPRKTASREDYIENGFTTVHSSSTVHRTDEEGPPPRTPCKAHHARACEECYREMERLIDEGTKPRFAMEDVYLQEEE